MLAAADLLHAVLVAELVGDDVGDLNSLAPERVVAGLGREVRKVQADAGEPGVEVRADPVEPALQLARAHVEQLECLVAAPEMVQRVRDAVQTVVEPDARARLGMHCALQQPRLVLGMAARARDVERVQHAGPL